MKYIPPTDNEKEKSHFIREKDLKGHMPEETIENEEKDIAGEDEEVSKKAKMLIEKDNQVRYALQLLQTWNLFSHTKP
jgi:hypothetical protein